MPVCLHCLWLIALFWRFLNPAYRFPRQPAFFVYAFGHWITRQAEWNLFVNSIEFISQYWIAFNIKHSMRNDPLGALKAIEVSSWNCCWYRRQCQQAHTVIAFAYLSHTHTHKHTTSSANTIIAVHSSSHRLIEQIIGCLGFEALGRFAAFPLFFALFHFCVLTLFPLDSNANALWNITTHNVNDFVWFQRNISIGELSSVDLWAQLFRTVLCSCLEPVSRSAIFISSGLKSEKGWQKTGGRAK